MVAKGGAKPPARPMREKLYDAAWGLGVRSWSIAKRLGVLGPLEPILLKLAPFLIPPPAEEVEIALPWGANMLVPPGSSRARNYSTGLYERDVTALFQDTVKEGMTVVDLGAYIGYYTLLASRLVGASGRVYAFEPDCKNYSYLVRNTSANDCRNVLAESRAVANRTGSATFIAEPDGEKSHLSGVPEKTASMVVQTVTLDDFFAEEGWPSVDLVKMDIEGSERAALEGMRELSRRNPGMRLIMEFNCMSMRRADASRDELVALLMELDFRRGYIIERDLKPFSLPEGFPDGQAVYNLLLARKVRAGSGDTCEG